MSCRGETPTPPIVDEFGRSSPPPSCAICLGSYKNKSFTENCLHQFCFNCLLKWSKIKAECPLCKQPFKNIIHNVRSNDSYDKYNIGQETRNDLTSDLEAYYAHRFQYRTTLTLNPRDNFAIHRLLYGVPQRNNIQSAPIDLTIGEPLSRYGSRSYFRRSIYLQNLWVRPLPDFTGRFRDCTAEFYRNNPAQLNRLVPWLTRELSQCTYQENIVYLISRLTEMLKTHAITSRTIRDFLASYINVNVDHFIHEFHTFARTPYDMVGYDRYLEYQTGNPYDNYVNEISSSDSEDSADSDIIVMPSVLGAVPSNNDTNAIEEVSYTPPHSPPQPTDLVSVSHPVIEFISHSETDDSDNEVVMVKYIKPPHERTPEIVDLAASDSDDVIIEENLPTSADSMSCNPSTMNMSECSLSSNSVKLPSSDSYLNLPSTSGLGKPNLKRTISKTSYLSDSDTDNDSNVSNYEKLKYFKTKLMKQHKSAEVNDSSSSTSSNMSLAVQYSPQNSTKNISKRTKEVSCADVMRNYLASIKNSSINQLIVKKRKSMSCDVNDSTSCSSSNTSLAVQCSPPHSTKNMSNFKRSKEQSHEDEMRLYLTMLKDDKPNEDSDKNNDKLINYSSSESCSLIRKKNKSSKKSKHKKSRRKSADYHSGKKHKHKSKSKKKSKSKEPSDDKTSKRKDSHNKSKQVKDRHNDASGRSKSSYWPKFHACNTDSESDHNPEWRAKTLKSIISTVPQRKSTDDQETAPSGSADTRDISKYDNPAGTSHNYSTDTVEYHFGSRTVGSEDESS